MNHNDCNGGMMVALTGDLAERLDFALGELKMRARVRRSAQLGAELLDEVLNCAKVQAHRLDRLVGALRAEGDDELDGMAAEVEALLSAARRAQGAAA